MFFVKRQKEKFFRKKILKNFDFLRKIYEKNGPFLTEKTG